MFRWLRNLFYKTTPIERRAKGVQDTLDFLAKNPTDDEIQSCWSAAHTDRGFNPEDSSYSQGAIDTLRPSWKKIKEKRKDKFPWRA